MVDFGFVSCKAIWTEWMGFMKIALYNVFYKSLKLIKTIDGKPTFQRKLKYNTWNVN